MSTCIDVASALLTHSPRDIQPHWSLSAQDMIAALVMFECACYPPAERSFARIRANVTQSTDGLRKLVREIVASELTPAVRKATRFLGTSVEVQNIQSSAVQNTSFLDEPAYINALSGDAPFRFEAMKRERMTVFVVLPAHQLDIAKGGKFLRLIINSAISAFLSSPRSSTEPGVLMVIDELAALGHLSSVSVFGDSWHAVVSSCSAQVCFKTPDKETATYYSEMAGARTEIVPSESVHLIQQNHDGKNFQPISTPLYRPDDIVFGLPGDGALVLMRGLSGPVEVRVPGMWSLPALARMTDPNPYSPPGARR